MAVFDDPGGPWIPHSVRQELPGRLKAPEDLTLPAEADGYLRINPEDSEIRKVHQRLPGLDPSEYRG